MKNLIAILFIAFPISSSAEQSITLPEDEWQPLTLRQAESVCVYNDVKRPGIGTKYHDVHVKKRRECIDKTLKYGLVGKNFIGISGYYREEKAVRARQLDMERQNIMTQQSPASPNTTPATTTRGGSSSINQRLSELEVRIKQLEIDNTRLRKEIEALKPANP